MPVNGDTKKTSYSESNPTKKSGEKLENPLKRKGPGGPSDKGSLSKLNPLFHKGNKQ